MFKPYNEAHIKRTYGIDGKQYMLMFNNQKGNCAVCGRNYTEFTKNLSVDHDHKTMEIRGLLCTYCNQRVIGRHRDPDLLHAASRYLLLGHTGWYVPKKKKKRKK